MHGRACSELPHQAASSAVERVQRAVATANEDAGCCDRGGRSHGASRLESPLHTALPVEQPIGGNARVRGRTAKHEADVALRAGMNGTRRNQSACDSKVSKVAAHNSRRIKPNHADAFDTGHRRHGESRRGAVSRSGRTASRRGPSLMLPDE